MFFMNDQLTSMFEGFQPSTEKFANSLKSLFPGMNQFPATPNNPFFGNEQFANAVKSSLETQVAFYDTLAASNLHTIEKLTELNISTAKVTVEESGVIAKQLLNSKDPQEVHALLSALPQSILAKMTAYGSHVANIGSASQIELTRAKEQRFAKIGVKLSSLIDEASKDLPAGAESSAATAKAVIASASAGYEQFSKNAEQAAEVVATQASDAAEKASKRAAQEPVTSTRVSPKSQ